MAFSYKRIRLTDMEQCLIRVALLEHTLKLERFKSPDLQAKAAEYRRILDLTYTTEIELNNDFAEVCERCNEKPCVCGDRAFETANIIELNRAEDVR